MLIAKRVRSISWAETGGQLEAGRQVAFDDHREIVARQGRQAGAAAPGLDRHAVLTGFQADLAAIRQLAGNVEQQVRRHGDRTRPFHRYHAHRFDHLEVKIGRHNPHRPAGRGLDQRVREGSGWCRRSTTDCACDRRLSSVARSMVAFMSTRVPCRRRAEIAATALHFGLSFLTPGGCPASAKAARRGDWGINAGISAFNRHPGRRRDRCHPKLTGQRSRIRSGTTRVRARPTKSSPCRR